MFTGQKAIREKEFPQLAGRVWLNTAAFAPHSKSVIKAMQRIVQQWHDPKLDGSYDEYYAEISSELYSGAARLLDCQKENIALIVSTAHGLNFPLHGIDWQEGDNIVTSQLEFPTNYMPWLYLSRQKKVELREAKYDKNYHLHEDEIIDLIDDKTKLVSLSLVQFNTGQRIDVSRIAKVAHEHGALVALDAIQACGGLEVYPTKMAVDFVSAGGPKFLMGPLGLGICYISSQVLETMEPPLQGTGNYDFLNRDWNDRTVKYYKGAKRFENGTIPVYCVAGLNASIKLINSVGIQTVAKHNLDLTQQLYEGFEDLGLKVITPKVRAKRGALLNVRLEKKFSPEEVVKLLEEKYKVTVSARFGGLRFSTQLFNTEEDIKQALTALGEILS